mgnify:CR=1 FL=1
MGVGLKPEKDSIIFRSLKRSFADSIDCDAPCAKEGGNEKNASPIKKIFLLLGILIFLLTKIGKHLISFTNSVKFKSDFNIIE